MNSNILLYLVSVSIYLDVLFLAHRYVFTKYSYLKWDRVYFLIIVSISFLLPFVPTLEIFRFSTKQLLLNQLFNGIDISEGLMTVKTSNHFYNLPNLGTKAALIYLFGVLVKAILFFREIAKMIKVTHSFKRYNIQSFNVYLVEQKQLAFTFFNRIFVSKKFLELESAEQLKILKHESVHKTQWHTMDIIFVRLVSIVLWFNPLNNIIVRTIRSLHEFLADEGTVEIHNKKEYMQLLLNMAIKEKSLSTVSYFARLNLKGRILIMQRMGSTKRFQRLFISSLPVFFLLFILLSFGNQLVQANTIFSKTEYLNPFGKEYNIVVPYFKLEQISEHYKLSHEKLAVELPDNSPVFALSDAIVKKNQVIDNWGVDEHIVELKTSEYLFVFEGLKASNVLQNSIVKQGDTIGYTGKKALYPTVKFTVYKNGKIVSPNSIVKL